jgi:nucleotide-binding universal stress UspA family protein
MQLIKKILCATDVSKDSSHLLSFGIDFCIRFNASLLIFHAVPPPHGSVARKIEFERGGEKQEQIKNAQAKIKAQMSGCTIKWESVITYGDPVLETAKKATEAKPDMVMAESLGLSGFQQFFIGSVVGNMAQTVMSPFLVIPPGKPFSKTNHMKSKFTHIIVACGLTASDSHLIKYALAFLEHFDSTIHLVHVMESPLNERVVASTSAPYEQVQSRLEKTLSVQLKKMMPGKTKILHGVPGEELALYAKNHGIELIIAGIKDHPGRIIPSTTASLIRHLPCALLTIPLSR